MYLPDLGPEASRSDPVAHDPDPSKTQTWPTIVHRNHIIAMAQGDNDAICRVLRTSTPRCRCRRRGRAERGLQRPPPPPPPHGGPIVGQAIGAAPPPLLPLHGGLGQVWDEITEMNAYVGTIATRVAIIEERVANFAEWTIKLIVGVAFVTPAAMRGLRMLLDARE